MLVAILIFFTSIISFYSSLKFGVLWVQSKRSGPIWHPSFITQSIWLLKFGQSFFIYSYCSFTLPIWSFLKLFRFISFNIFLYFHNSRLDLHHYQNIENFRRIFQKPFNMLGVTEKKTFSWDNVKNEK